MPMRGAETTMVQSDLEQRLAPAGRLHGRVWKKE